ncbi:MAG: hypothetical protein EA404_08055 [Spirochaetaceae bacterium]|nr:MAG: hypothetical protein EA404_08055 [Spirochaetaceae bacterium]
MSWFSVLLISLLVTAAAVVLLIRRIERRIEPTAVLNQIRGEVDELIVEFNQTTERNIGLLEERIVRLNRLIETADRRVAVLRRELDAHESGTRVYSDIVQQAAVQRRQEHEQQADKQNEGGSEDRRAQIMDLYEKGIAPNIIAARVGTTVGEVELIVSMRRRKP